MMRVTQIGGGVLQALLSGAFALALAACAATPAGPDAHALAQPVFEGEFREDYGGRLIVQAMVNGEGPFDFILDTAATQSAVFSNLTDRLSLTVEEDAQRRVFSLAGLQERPTTALELLQLGDIARPGLNVVVFSDWDDQERTPQGVLGLDVLSSYVLRIDARSSRLSLYRRDNAPSFSAMGWGEAALRPTNFGLSGTPLYLLPGDISNHRFEMLLDTGSEISIGNFALLERILVAPRVVDLGATATRFNDVFDRTVEIYDLRYSNLGSSGISWGDGHMYFTEAQIFRDLGYQDASFAILGNDVLTGRSIAIDFVGLTIHASPFAPASGGEDE